MKKLLMGSIVLSLFSISMILFQFSCKKEVKAQTTGNNQPLNKVLLTKHRQVITGYTPPDSSGNTNPIIKLTADFYFINYDGTNPTPINLPLPNGIYPREGRLNPDNTKIVFRASTEWNLQSAIYVYELNGASGLVKIADSTYTLQDAY